MFNFLASQHRELPDMLVGPIDEEEDEFPLKSSRLVDYIFATLLIVTLNFNPLHSTMHRNLKLLKDAMSMWTPRFLCLTLTGEPPAVSFPWQ